MVHKHKLTLGEGWAGEVGIEVPPHHLRMMVIMKHEAEDLPAISKNSTPKEKKAWGKKSLPVLSNVYAEIRGCVKSVEITGPEGVKISSLDELERHPVGEMAWVEIAILYCMGFGPGKTKSLT